MILYKSVLKNHRCNSHQETIFSNAFDPTCTRQVHGNTSVLSHIRNYTRKGLPYMGLVMPEWPDKYVSVHIQWGHFIKLFFSLAPSKQKGFFRLCLLHWTDTSPFGVPHIEKQQPQSFSFVLFSENCHVWCTRCSPEGSINV